VHDTPLPASLRRYALFTLVGIAGDTCSPVRSAAKPATNSPYRFAVPITARSTAPVTSERGVVNWYRPVEAHARERGADGLERTIRAIDSDILSTMAGKTPE
jgi:hypothetical protein